ncbi:flavin reductase like domain-containing protein [Podospora didyma]|uniref:Flavin reductase like domain-containing protein n=1 Tax=Podospora didyma TaxID=330526 RepID=A0AAE0K4T7_9PEZI|nr:flavin reductase like domain-containing protein [Podospora didyma]
MSSRRVLGLVAEHALPQLPPSRNGAALIMTVRLPAVATAQQLCLASTSLPGRIMGVYRESSFSPRCFHTSSSRPRLFKLSSRQQSSPRPQPTPSSSPADATTAPPMSEQVRKLMRHVAHSVVVCTSMSPASGSEPATPRAMTMSSFTSLGLKPTPVVSFNMQTPSRTFDSVERSRRFNIHILADGPSGASVADWFTRGNADGIKLFEKLADECHCEVVAQQQQEYGEEAPILRGPGVLYVLRCRLLTELAESRGLIRMRDHVIVLGEVLEIIEGEQEVAREAEEPQGSSSGLVYANGTYRRLGISITPVKDGAHDHTDGRPIRGAGASPIPHLLKKKVAP